MVKVAAAASNARLIPSFFKICSFKHKLHHSTSACNVVYGTDVNAARNSSTLCLTLVSALGNKNVAAPARLSTPAASQDGGTPRLGQIARASCRERVCPDL